MGRNENRNKMRNGKESQDHVQERNQNAYKSKVPFELNYYKQKKGLQLTDLNSNFKKKIQLNSIKILIKIVTMDKYF